MQKKKQELAALKCATSKTINSIKYKIIEKQSLIIYICCSKFPIILLKITNESRIFALYIKVLEIIENNVNIFFKNQFYLNFTFDPVRNFLDLQFYCKRYKTVC